MQSIIHMFILHLLLNRFGKKINQMVDVHDRNWDGSWPNQFDVGLISFDMDPTWDFSESEWIDLWEKLDEITIVQMGFPVDFPFNLWDTL